jgi:hypothetical protein
MPVPAVLLAGTLEDIEPGQLTNAKGLLPDVNYEVSDGSIADV